MHWFAIAYIMIYLNVKKVVSEVIADNVVFQQRCVKFYLKYSSLCITNNESVDRRMLNSFANFVNEISYSSHIFELTF